MSAFDSKILPTEGRFSDPLKKYLQAEHGLTSIKDVRAAVKSRTSRDITTPGEWYIWAAKRHNTFLKLAQNEIRPQLMPEDPAAMSKEQRKQLFDEAAKVEGYKSPTDAKRKLKMSSVNEVYAALALAHNFAQESMAAEYEKQRNERREMEEQQRREGNSATVIARLVRNKRKIEKAYLEREGLTDLASRWDSMTVKERNAVRRQAESRYKTKLLKESAKKGEPAPRMAMGRHANDFIADMPDDVHPPGVKGKLYPVEFILSNSMITGFGDDSEVNEVTRVVKKKVFIPDGSTKSEAKQRVDEFRESIIKALRTKPFYRKLMNKHNIRAIGDDQ